MLKTELRELIASGENSGLEFKRDDLRPERLAREIVALANAWGGRILLGVEDDGRISGLQRADAREWVLNVFRDKVHPQIIPFYEEICLDDGLKVGLISISPGAAKPYVLRHNHREDIYIRLGDRSELATREQQARLFQAGGLFRAEMSPVSGSSFQSLDQRRLDFYLREIIKDPEPPVSEDDWLERLNGLGLMTGDGLGRQVCTIAGLLCFGLKPRRFLPQAGLRLMVFNGLDKEYKAELDVILDAPMAARWEIAEKGQKILADDGLAEKFAAAVSPFITEEAPDIDSHMRRERRWLYPWAAVREATVNALAHRDWTIAVDIEVAVYADRLEIISPGGLPNSMTVKKMTAGRRSPRNPALADILRDYGYVDARGMGVRAKIIPLMRSHNRTEPVFEAEDDRLLTVLPRGGDATQVDSKNTSKTL